ncbi:hypothetical protein MJO29_009282, partial [Puccinia striiformis f. sp. tritici]
SYFPNLFDLLSSSHHCDEVLAPSLVFRLWDASGLNRLPCAVDLPCRNSRSVVATYPALSLCIYQSIVLELIIWPEFHFQGNSFAYLTTLSAGSTNYIKHSLTKPSAIMASPAQHQSAHEDVFSHSNCSSGSSCSELLMDLTSGPPATLAMSTSSCLIGHSTRETWRSVADSISVKQSGKTQIKQLKYNQEFQLLTSVNLAPRKQVQNEFHTVRDVFQAIGLIEPPKVLNLKLDASIDVQIFTSIVLPKFICLMMLKKSWDKS